MVFTQTLSKAQKAHAFKRSLSSAEIIAGPSLHRIAVVSVIRAARHPNWRPHSSRSLPLVRPGPAPLAEMPRLQLPLVVPSSRRVETVSTIRRQRESQARRNLGSVRMGHHAEILADGEHLCSHCLGQQLAPRVETGEEPPHQVSRWDSDHPQAEPSPRLLVLP